MPNEENRRAQYDAMSTEELEEILRLDAELPEGQESDEEMILYVMEVLARRRRNSDNPGKTVEEAWASFEQHYLPKEDETAQIKMSPKHYRPWLHRWIAAAAVLAILVGIPTVSGALSWKKVWTTVATWADGRFSFITTEKTPTKNPSASTENFKAFRKFLALKDKKNAEVPMWLPDGFELKDITIHETPASTIYTAFYSNDEKIFVIQIQSDLQSSSSKTEINNDILETYTTSGVDFYVFNNDRKLSAIWFIDNYVCYISGDLALTEIKTMIESIVKG